MYLHILLAFNVFKCIFPDMNVCYALHKIYVPKVSWIENLVPNVVILRHDRMLRGGEH
jgi:hypothetical protein